MLGGHQTVSSSNIPMEGNALDGTSFAANPPKSLTESEIKDTVQEFAAAAKRALEAGFDGIELHG